MRILLVEDEVALSDALVQIFHKNKYIVDACYDGESGLDNALSGIYDMIVLDFMLPKMSGYDVLKELRAKKVTTPVMMLTARDTISDKVDCLDIGADDYMTKPFSSDELLARMRSLYRRNANVIFENVLSWSDLTLNLSTYELFCGKKLF